MTKDVFDVSVSMKFSHNFVIKADTPGEAKKKALEKMQKIAAKKSSFEMFVNKR